MHSIRCYHYLQFSESGRAQADFYLDTVTSAGAWAEGDLPPIVDVERGSANSSNHSASKQQIIDVTSEWAETVATALGRRPILYGRGAMQAFGITDRMGCDWLWAPRYNHELGSTDDIGWPSERVIFWQYTDGQSDFTDYPRQAPGIGSTDMSIFLGSGLDALLALVRGC